MSRSKRKPEAHIIGEEAVRIIEALLPAHWTIREYHPDYGIDLAVEVFERSGTETNGHPAYDTLGEHLFLQVKGCRSIEPIQFKVTDRINVEIADPNVSTLQGGDEKRHFWFFVPDRNVRTRNSAADGGGCASAPDPCGHIYSACFLRVPERLH